MRNIEVKVLNPEAVKTASDMMVCAARLTQRGHNIKSMADFMELYNRPHKDETAIAMTHLPHPTIQKFAVINVAIVGASRRFLAQITRHENETKFMSASLQYSTYGTDADFVVPYNIIKAGPEAELRYLRNCKAAMEEYTYFNKQGIDNDSCGYMAPQGLRNILIMSCTPYQWKHIIGQRTCRRNTPETRFVMLKIWEQLYALDPIFFAPDTTGPFCMRGACKEGKMACGRPLDKNMTPSYILRCEFPLLCKEV